MYQFRNQLTHLGLDFKGFVTAGKQPFHENGMTYGGSVKYMLTQSHDLYGRVITESLIKEKLFQDDLQHFALHGYHPVVDTKMVQLMPGQYPCIPGWHCDGVIRKDRESQPDLRTLGLEVPHYIVTISDILDASLHCGTDIMDSYKEMDENLVDEEKVWKSVNEHFKDAQRVKDYFPGHNGMMYRITRSTLHRGQQCKARQWRYFYRLSFYHMPAMNKERKQVTVYADPNGGW